jgi:hypothetical protein
MTRQKFIESLERDVRELSDLAALLDQHIGCEHTGTSSVGNHCKTGAAGSWLLTQYFGHVEQFCDRVHTQNSDTAKGSTQNRVLARQRSGVRRNRSCGGFSCSRL